MAQICGQRGPTGQRGEDAMLRQKFVRHVVGFPRAIRALRLPYQLCVVKICTLLVSRTLRCSRCAKQFPIPSRFVLEGSLKRFQSFSWALGIEQHFAQQLACRQPAAAVALQRQSRLVYKGAMLSPYRD